VKRYVIIVFWTVFAGCTSPQKPNFSPSQPHLKVVTYNVNWGFVRPTLVVDFLDRTDADIICLQETHSQWESVIKMRLLTRCPYSIFKSSGGAGGIAIMSKYPLKDVQIIEPNEGWFPALLAKARTPIGEIQVLNVHLRPPLSDTGSVTVSGYYRAPDIHLKEIKGFLAKTDPDKPLIVTGDFNEDENDKAIRWLIENGFMDTLSTFDTYTKTWIWKTSAGISLKDRYDHIIVSSHLASTGAAVANVRASDHLPVIAAIVQK
jgi:endonuclease/exonuclease/phosphatase family metal-dependent hydrolase